MDTRPPQLDPMNGGAVFRTAARPKSRVRIVATCAVLVTMVPGMGLAGIWAAAQVEAVVAQFALGLLAATVLCIGLWCFSLARRTWRAETAVYTLDAAGIVCVSLLGRAHVRWDEIDDVRVAPDYAYPGTFRIDLLAGNGGIWMSIDCGPLADDGWPLVWEVAERLKLLFRKRAARLLREWRRAPFVEDRTLGLREYRECEDWAAGDARVPHAAVGI